MRYLLKNHPECVVFVKEHEEPIEIDTCSKEGGTRVTHQMGIRYRYISTTGQPSEEYIYETDVIEGGSTGDCTVLQILTFGGTRSLAQAEQGEAASAGRRVPRAHQYSGGSQNNTRSAQSHLGDAISGE